MTPPVPISMTTASNAGETTHTDSSDLEIRKIEAMTQEKWATRFPRSTLGFPNRRLLHAGLCRRMQSGRLGSGLVALLRMACARSKENAQTPGAAFRAAVLREQLATDRARAPTSTSVSKGTRAMPWQVASTPMAASAATATLGSPGTALQLATMSTRLGDLHGHRGEFQLHVQQRIRRRWHVVR